MPTLDPAILRALSLPADTRYTLSPHGSSHFTTTSKLTIRTSPPQHYFLKTSTAPSAAAMFTGEYTSLRALSQHPRLTATPLAHGALDASRGHFLLTDFLNLTSRAPSPGAPSLARKLAALHKTDTGERAFGFPVPTFCGSTRQPNTPHQSWVDFFASERLAAILTACEKQGYADAELVALGERVRAEVVPRLLGRLRDVRPALVHGDLWSGNKGRAVFDEGTERECVEEVVFDACSSYAHWEFEAGIMKMFGGFDAAFWAEYEEATGGWDEPREEGPARVKLYELYHHLNHTAIFGGGYREGAKGIMRQLLAEYGKGGSKYEYQEE